MRIACIGDLHGVDRWKEVKEMEVDEVVFVGDYVDSHDLDDSAIFQNLQEVLAFKREANEKVTLLLGNHDVHYLYHPNFRATGFRNSMQQMLTQLFQENQSLFQVAYAIDSYLITHAGVSKSWVSQHIGAPYDAKSLAEALNRMQFDGDSLQQLAEIGVARGGRASYGGPFWCDFHRELFLDPILGIHQVVGHTQSKFLIREEVGDSWLIDVNYLAYSDEEIFILEL